MPQATIADIVDHISHTGGATVTLHGRRYIMGDEFDGAVYVVGGARDDYGKTYTATWTRWMSTSHANRETIIASALAAMKGRTARNSYVYTAAGFWVNDDGHLVVDLVETTTIRGIAMMWAERRGEDAIAKLKHGQDPEIIYTPSYLERLVQTKREAVGA